MKFFQIDNLNIFCSNRRSWQVWIVRAAAVIAFNYVFSVQVFAANPLVRIGTSYGDFTIDLLVQEAPATVNNFLGYVDRGDFSRIVVHRLDKIDNIFEAGSHIWAVDCAGTQLPPACGPVLVPTGPVVVNEPGVSNTRGTVAMAKIQGFVNSATNSWLVNLDDNSSSRDSLDGGYTVFGRVLGDGMDVMDRISALSTTAVSPAAPLLPVRDFVAATDITPVEKNLVMLNAYRISRHTSNLHVFDFSTSRLSTYVNAGELGRLSLLLRLVEDGAQTVFQIEPGTIIALAIEPEGMASFSMDDQRLRIPRVEVNNSNGTVSEVRNVVLRMIDETNLRFVLESFDQ